MNTNTQLERVLVTIVRALAFLVVCVTLAGHSRAANAQDSAQPVQAAQEGWCGDWLCSWNGSYWDYVTPYTYRSFPDPNDTLGWTQVTYDATGVQQMDVRLFPTESAYWVHVQMNGVALAALWQGSYSDLFRGSDPNSVYLWLTDRWLTAQQFLTLVAAAQAQASPVVGPGGPLIGAPGLDAPPYVIAAAITTINQLLHLQ
jgi:hypothetical protein